MNLSTSFRGFHLVWWCRLFDYSTYIPFCVHWHRGQCLRRLVPNYAVVFRFGWVYLPVKFYKVNVKRWWVWNYSNWKYKRRFIESSRSAWCMTFNIQIYKNHIQSNYICTTACLKYAWDSCDSSIIFLHSVYAYIQCVSNMHGTHMIANSSTTNNVVFFFVSDLKIVYYNHN